MSVKVALYDHLRTSTPIAAVVGTRIRANFAKQGETVPYIVYRRIGEDRVYKREAPGFSGITKVRFNIECWDDDDLGPESLYALVRNRIDGFRGAMGTGNLDVRGLFITDVVDAHLPPAQAGELGMFAVVLTIEINHLESAPTHL